MRWLAAYLRQVFCKHDFVTTITGPHDEVVRKGPKVSLFCPKCGYHRTFWKF